MQLARNCGNIRGLRMNTLIMASGSVGQSTSASTPGTVVISCLQEIQMRVQRMETKQTQMQSSLDELKEVFKASQESSFTVKGSPFQVCVYDTAAVPSPETDLHSLSLSISVTCLNHLMPAEAT